MSSALVWELVKNNNSFLRKGKQPNASFSAEPGNLFNKSSYKYSGRATPRDNKIVGVGKGGVAWRFCRSQLTSNKVAEKISRVQDSAIPYQAESCYQSEITHYAYRKSGLLKVDPKRHAHVHFLNFWQSLCTLLGTIFMGFLLASCYYCYEEGI